ncbi:hypothetical protein PROFUN_03252 [Planoprotostelium fungivorum]|uniref:UBX domain-containing protein n=1 Tax=Planoprotostelium fungivorum TaxID=1890364 RepID=A0A2P6NWS5_9EUKA|nr:hypothetical protein PROFUN_03252 [Planoprotostelium fungivorum]
MPIHTLNDVKKGGNNPAGGNRPPSIPSGPPDSKNVRHVAGDNSDFAKELRKTNNLVVAYFTATWCGPCKMISPKFSQLADQHTDVVFLKIDVDEAQEIARDRGVKAMPTFQFYRNGDKLGEFTGANPSQLESDLLKYKSQSSSSSGGSSFSSGGGNVLGGGNTLGGATGGRNFLDQFSAQGTTTSTAAAPTATPPTDITTPAPTPSASEQPTDAPALVNGLNPVFIATLMEMGFTQAHAQKGLRATGDTNMEAATEWCLSHPPSDDPMEVEGSTGQETVKKPLTEEQRAEQKARLEARLEAMRETKKKEEEERDRLRELNRIKGGKEALDAKKKYDEKQMEIQMAKQKKEKEDDAKAKAAIRAKIEQDKRERESAAIARKAGTAPAQPAAAPATAPVATGAKKEYEHAFIQLRLPDGGVIKAKFNPQDTVRSVHDHVVMLLGVNANSVSLLSNFPKKVYSNTEGDIDSTTLVKAELVPTGTLIVSKK